jgi:hypothetical protein
MLVLKSAGILTIFVTPLEGPIGSFYLPQAQAFLNFEVQTARHNRSLTGCCTWVSKSSHKGSNNILK